jgi:hypothetical protein
MQDLEKTMAEMLAVARKLPPGEERQNILKEIGRFRVRLDDHSVRLKKSQTAKRAAD